MCHKKAARASRRKPKARRPPSRSAGPATVLCNLKSAVRHQAHHDRPAVGFSALVKHHISATRESLAIRLPLLPLRLGVLAFKNQTRRRNAAKPQRAGDSPPYLWRRFKAGRDLRIAPLPGKITTCGGHVLFSHWMKSWRDIVRIRGFRRQQFWREFSGVPRRRAGGATARASATGPARAAGRTTARPGKPPA